MGSQSLHKPSSPSQFTQVTRLIHSDLAGTFDMHLSLIASLLVAVATTTVTAKPHHRTPRVQTRNGTYEGVHSREWDQDYFLGVPYAQPPVGDLRFRNPRSLNKSWHGTHEALEYSDTCVGYGVSLTAWHMRWTAS